MALPLFSHSKQVAAHLRGEILKGRWSGVMPGILSLGKDLGVNHNTVDAALRLLEEDGLLVAQGKGRPRRIVLPRDHTRPAMRVRLLTYDKFDRAQAQYVDLLARLQEAGFAAEFAPRSLQDLGMEVERVAGFVAKHPADAWVVIAASRAVLEWFAEQPFATFAMFGRMSGLPIAGMSPRKVPAMITAVRKLIELGHRRIVMLVREERRKPHPAIYEQAFLDELAAQGITPGPYNLPDWEDSREDFHRCLDSLFRLTPPTALIVSEPRLYIAALQHLALQGILANRQVSMICDDPDPAFSWCVPEVAHIHWEERPILDRVQHWADNIAHGRIDRRQSYTRSVFVEGGTVGPVKT
jgi:DNA-binding transcriptional regulator YhcF (GntR family)